MKSTDVSDDSPLGVETLLSVVGQDFEPSQQAVERARAFAEPFIATQALDHGENSLAHADALACWSSLWAAQMTCRLRRIWLLLASI